MLAAFPEETGGFTSRRSSDGGQTWRDAPTWPTWCAYQFPDGELIQVHSHFLTDTDQEGVYETVLDRSMDNGYTYQRETVQLIGVPTLAPEINKPGRPRYVDHSIVALRDGSLLAGALAKFASDRQPKERSFVVRSTDRGRTWHYVSTVAFDLTPGDARRLDGHADPIADRGVFPTSCLMSNGVLVVSYGRPGDWLAFSLDMGHTWIGHFCLRQGPQHTDCSFYDAVAEVSPDTLLVAYGCTDPNDSWQAELLGTFITVKRS